MKQLKHLETSVVRLILTFTALVFLLFSYAALTNGWAHAVLLSVLAIDPLNPPTPDWHTNLLLVGRDMLLRGIIVTGALLWAILPPSMAARWLTLFHMLWRKRVITLIAMLILVICWVPVIVVGYSEVIGGTRYWWLFDDAMISMRYGHNLARGFGLVWNDGEQIEGYTNFLWVIYMALVHMLPVPITTTSLVVALTNVALSVAAIPLIMWIATMLRAGMLAKSAMLMSYVLSLHIMGWATAGAETALFAVGMLAAVASMLRDEQHQQPHMRTYFIIGTMTLVRSDALIIAAALYGMAFVLATHHRKTVVRYAALSLLLPLAHMLFRVVYYGDIMPNTAYLKLTQWDNRYSYGMHYVVSFASEYGVLLIAAVLGTLIARRSQLSLLLGVLILHITYVAYAGGDVFKDYRFLVPIVPLLIILAFTGIHTIIRMDKFRLMVVALCIISMPLLVPGTTTPLYQHHMAVGNIKIALLYKENVSPTRTVADFWAGIPFYFSDMHGVDLLGKNDSYIAHLPALYGDLPGHNKFDFDYSIGMLKPDFVNSSFLLPLDEEDIYNKATSIAPWRGQLYLNETFRTHCLPYPVTVSTWRALYTCDWSPEMQRRTEWVVPYE